MDSTNNRVVTDSERGADFACANLSFDGGLSNPLANALPPFVCLPLSALPGAGPVLDRLFEEAFGQNCGRQTILDRLFEVVLIQVVRYLMEEGDTNVGLLAGLAHARLRRALVAMHEKPEHNWSLAELADHAGMSRSMFASTFKETVGDTPGNYLEAWRIAVAKQALIQSQPLKLIAGDVGYGSEAALSRAFKASEGCAPREWLKRQALKNTH